MIRLLYEHIIKPLKRLEPSEFEYLSMIGLILWKTDDSSQILSTILPIIQRSKEEILQSFHNYFIYEKKLFCYAQRLAEIFSIISAIEKAIEKTTEDAVLAELFNVFKFDIYLSKFFE